MRDGRDRGVAPAQGQLKKRPEVKWISQPLEDISPETAAKIAAQAKALGLSIDVNVRQTLHSRIKVLGVDKYRFKVR
jgi:hypothetical protein